MNPSSSTSKGQFELSSNQNGYYFHYKDADGNILLRSQEYQTASSRDRGIKTVLKNAKDKQKYEIKSADQDYYFVLKGGNHQAIARGAMLESREQVEQAIHHFQAHILEETATKKATASPKEERPQRYSFRLDLYYSEEDRDWSGKIEYPFGKAKKSIKGLDENTILEFINTQLPNLKEEKTLAAKKLIPKSENSLFNKSKVTDFYLLKNGNRISNNIIERLQNYELCLNFEDLTAGLYSINVFAQSLDNPSRAKIGERLCSISSDYGLVLPIATEILSSGSFRISTAIKAINGQKETLLEEHFYAMVYGN